MEFVTIRFIFLALPFFALLALSVYLLILIIQALGKYIRSAPARE